MLTERSKLKVGCVCRTTSGLIYQVIARGRGWYKYIVLFPEIKRRTTRNTRGRTTVLQWGKQGKIGENYEPEV